MPANGVVQGMRPIISYNYGAGDQKRMNETIRTACFVDRGDHVPGDFAVHGIPWRDHADV